MKHGKSWTNVRFMFYYFLWLKANLDLEKTNQLGESSPNFISTVVNLEPIILEKRWIDGESWPNNFVEKVNRGEDLRWVGSRCPLTCALEGSSFMLPRRGQCVWAGSTAPGKWQEILKKSWPYCKWDLKRNV